MGNDYNDFRVSRMPDTSDQNFGWVIRRAPTDGVLKLIVLSVDIFGIRTHFFRGRTGPCSKLNCDACEHKMLSRWKGYILAIDAATEQQLVFEFTPPAAVQLDESIKRWGTIRGVRLHVGRSGKKANSKVIVAVKDITVLGPTACPAYSVWPILSHIWGLTSDEQSQTCVHGTDDLSEFEKAA